MTAAVPWLAAAWLLLPLALGGSGCPPTFMGDALGHLHISERTAEDGPCKVSMNLVGKVCQGKDAECQRYLRSRNSKAVPSAFWTGFGNPEGMVVARPLPETSAPQVAVCIAGVARTMEHPLVYQSWGNFFGALAPQPNRKLFLYLKLADTKVAADKQHTHDASIGHHSAAELAPAIDALRHAGETIAEVKIDSADTQHSINPRCPLLGADGATEYTTPVQHLMASLSSLEKCYAMIEAYEQEHTMRFDIIAYQRPDLTWARPLPLRIGRGKTHSAEDYAATLGVTRPKWDGHSWENVPQLKDEIVLSCPKPADSIMHGVLCDVAAVMPRHHADLYFKRLSAYYACDEAKIYCLAIAYDFGLPAAFTNAGAAVRFLDMPAVIVRSEGSSMWARNSCSAREEVTGLSTDECLGLIYQGGQGVPSSTDAGPWWQPPVATVDGHVSLDRLYEFVRSERELSLVAVIAVVVVLRRCTKRGAWRGCKRTTCERKLLLTSAQDHTYSGQLSASHYMRAAAAGTTRV